MQTLKSIRLFYLFYTIYTLFVMAVSDYSLAYAFTGLFSIWVLYLSFSVGFRYSKNFIDIDQIDEDILFVSFPFSNIADWKNRYYLLNACVCWACSIMAARFYTSRNFVSVITSLLNGTSGYDVYQRYAQEANIGALTLSKIPYLLMLTYCTAMVFWSMIGILLSKNKPRPFQILYVILIIGGYLYFGIARGTNYEMYIVSVSLVYCIINNQQVRNHSFLKNRKRILFVAGIGIIMVVIFRIVVESRGFVFQNQICAEITYNPNRFISKHFPLITNMGLSVFRYLGWGIFTIGYMKWMALDSLPSIAALIVPQGQKLINGISWVDLTRLEVSVGVGWVPDYMSLLDFLGVPLLIVVIGVVGRFVAKLKSSDNPPLLVNIISLFIYIEMLSIPVGNFLVTSTPIMLSLFASLLWYVKCIIVAHRQRRESQEWESFL